MADACATRRYVDQELDDVERRLETIRAVAVETEPELHIHEREIDAAGETAALALQRAQAAEDLARAPLALEPVYRVDGLAFAAGSAELTSETRSTLEQLAKRLKLEDLAAHLEIRGHTDGSDGASRGLGLAGRRAEAVRRHLHIEEGIPLHWMRAIALGRAFESHGENRRVEIEVMRPLHP